MANSTMELVELNNKIYNAVEELGYGILLLSGETPFDFSKNIGDAWRLFYQISSFYGSSTAYTFDLLKHLTLVWEAQIIWTDANYVEHRFEGQGDTASEAICRMFLDWHRNRK